MGISERSEVRFLQSGIQEGGIVASAGGFGLEQFGELFFDPSAFGWSQPRE